MWLKRKLKNWSEKFWFIPAIMCVIALGLADALIRTETNYGVPPALSFVFRGGESGARSVLSTMTSMSIGVAGTLFSITIAALSSVISTMGPRLLRSFVRDRGIQVTLGVFLATFVFSLYSLRALSAGDDGTVFVPHYNVTGAMILSILCIAFLVYFIAHMAMSISMTRVVTLLAEDVNDAIEEATNLADESPHHDHVDDTVFAACEELRAPRNGYIDQIDYDAIARLAAEHHGIVRLYVKPGDHILRGHVMGKKSAGIPDFSESHVYYIRTSGSDHDPSFTVRQLVEVAVRALSPGINDPFTAADVIDRFAEVLGTLRDRELPDGYIDVDGTMRVKYEVHSFDDLVDLMLSDIRRNAAGSYLVYSKMFECIDHVQPVISDPRRLTVLSIHADLILADARSNVANETDLARLVNMHARVIDHLTPVT